MTAIAARRGHYRFRHVARMEWIKLRSLRSTWWTLALSAGAAIAIGIAVGLNTPVTSRHEDLTNNALGGVSAGLLLTGVLGVLMMTSEFTSGMIRATLAAAPKRPLMLAAKAAVFGGVALVLGEATSFIAFFAGGAALRHGIPAPTLSQPGVLRAVLLSGASFCLIGLLGMGLGAIIRHTAAAVGVMVGGVYVAAQAVAAFAHQLLPYLPVPIVANSLSASRAMTGDVPAPLSPWAGLGLLCPGGWLLCRRDA